MAVFKCKMCGGSLEFEPGATVGVCDSCGTQQTLPNSTNDTVNSLFNRANTLRLKAEFDRAEELYNKIVSLDDTQAEAYWGVILCKYGVEYVEDPKTFRRVPTCHRASFDAVTADEDYKLAVQHADAAQRAIYEAEAKTIDGIQKGILRIAGSEKPFDVFLCYKETDDSGARTPDSVIANDIYHQLTQEGFKVFYAAVTLEDKLGQEYEPYIFAALNSAKVMLVLGTRPEYFTAVWVKNEWSRFLKLMKADRSRLLIPCYRDMDAYELPDDFAHLQAQDMGKIGFINDVVRGIQKVVKKEKSAVPQPVVQQVANITALKKRGFLALEDGDWNKADGFFEEALNQNAEDAECYLGKLLAQLHVRTADDLKNANEPFDNNANAQKAARFDPAIAEQLKAANASIRERNENARKEAIYQSGLQKMKSAKTEAEFKEAAAVFGRVKGFKDADEQAQDCLEKAEIARKEAERIAAEHKQREEARRMAAKQAAKKRKKIIAVAVAAVAVLIVFAVVLTPAIKSAKTRKEFTQAYKEQKGNLSGATVGSVVKFGLYEQDNVKSNGKEEIEWQVLAVENGKALLISKYALDCKPYNEKYTGVTWETCTLRAWLNDEFYNTAFGKDHKKLIADTTVENKDNPTDDTDGGSNTNDKVFLLSIDEAKKYFDSNDDRMCAPTDYAIAQGAWTSYSDKTGGRETGWWWLRSPGRNSYSAAYVSNGGGVNSYDNYVSNDYEAVRPALWINLES